MTTANLIEIFCILDEFCKKKKTLLCSDVFFGCEVCSQKKTLLCSDVFFGCEVCSQKKTLLCSDVFFGCPDGLEPSTFRTTI